VNPSPPHKPEPQPSWFAEVITDLLERRQLTERQMRLAMHDLMAGSCGDVEHALGVQDPRVVAERPATGVASDEHAAPPEATRRHERVDRLSVSRGGAHPRPLGRSHAQRRLLALTSRTITTAISSIPQWSEINRATR